MWAYQVTRCDEWAMITIQLGSYGLRPDQITANPKLPIKLVSATHRGGKVARAEPVAALYEQHKVHHVGTFPQLEDEYCNWSPGDESPNRLDAAVWAFTELMLQASEIEFY